MQSHGHAVWPSHALGPRLGCVLRQLAPLNSAFQVYPCAHSCLLRQTASPAGKEAAVGAISNLACISAHQPAILGAGAAPLLLALMQPGASSGCQEAAARGFGNLVRLAGWSRVRAAAGSVLPWASQIQAATCCHGRGKYGLPAWRLLPTPWLSLQPPTGHRAPPSPCMQVCDSLSDTLRPVAYQAIPLLVGIVAGAAPPGGGGASSSAASGGSAAGGAHLARAGTSAGARQAAARAISNLVCSDTTVQVRPRWQAEATARQGGHLLPLVPNLCNEIPPVCNASPHAPPPSRLQVLVAKSGAAPALVELCRSPNEDLREAAAVALWDLAYDSSLGREAIARAGGLIWCNGGQPGRACLCAPRLQPAIPACMSPPFQPGLLPGLVRLSPGAGAVPWLSQLLLFGGTGAKEAAAACLAELAAVGPAVQQQIRDAGAVQLLQGLQRSGG